jgi:hypothetical protein
LHREAFASLKTQTDKPMQRLHRVGDTLKILRDCSGPPESDARLDTRPFVKLSHLPLSEKTVYGSRVRAEPADYRIFWQHSREDAATIELVDLVWPCR